MQSEFSGLLECAVAAARAAGEHALANVARRSETLSSAAHDVKLRLDVECQRKATDTILAAYPDHAILGEEDEIAGTVTPAGEWLWIVDPIDGTVNYSHGLPLWCVSVAGQRRGKTVAGAVFAPVLGELYTATLDGPSVCNGSEIRVSSVDDLARAVVHTGVDRHSDTGVPAMDILRRITGAVQRPRIMGSAALDICHVARGAADGYIESGVYTWDTAAGGLIVERAGGRVETLKRQGPQPHRIMFLATNGRLHEPLRRLIIG